MNFIIKHFQKHQTRPPLNFSFRVAIEALVIALTVASIGLLFNLPEREFPLSLEKMAIMAVIIAPPIETLFFQFLPILLIRAFKGSVRLQIVFSTICFIAAHLGGGAISALTAGVVGGVYFAFTFTHWLKISKGKAFWVTMLTHAIYNGIAMGLALVWKYLSQMG